MYERFALAHTLIGDPEVIILDEPTANLDVDSKLFLINVINNLKKGYLDCLRFHFNL